MMVAELVELKGMSSVELRVDYLVPWTVGLMGKSMVFRLVEKLVASMA